MAKKKKKRWLKAAKKVKMGVVAMGKSQTLSRTFLSIFKPPPQGYGRLRDGMWVPLVLPPAKGTISSNRAHARAMLAECYKRLNKHKGDHFWSHCTAGLALEAVGEHRKAAFHYKDALRMCENKGPDARWLLQRHAVTLRSQGPRKTRAAMDTLSKLPPAPGAEARSTPPGASCWAQHEAGVLQYRLAAGPTGSGDDAGISAAVEHFRAAALGALDTKQQQAPARHRTDDTPVEEKSTTRGRAESKTMARSSAAEAKKEGPVDTDKGRPAWLSTDGRRYDELMPCYRDGMTLSDELTQEEALLGLATSSFEQHVRVVVSQNQRAAAAAAVAAAAAATAADAHGDDSGLEAELANVPGDVVLDTVSDHLDRRGEKRRRRRQSREAKSSSTETSVNAQESKESKAASSSTSLSTSMSTSTSSAERALQDARQSVRRVREMQTTRGKRLAAERTFRRAEVDRLAKIHAVGHRRRAQARSVRTAEAVAREAEEDAAEAEAEAEEEEMERAAAKTREEREGRRTREMMGKDQSGVSASQKRNELLAAMKAAFEGVDTDGSGELDRDEFMKAMAGASVSPGQAEQLWTLSDADKSGEVSFAEFEQYAFDVLLQSGFDPSKASDGSGDAEEGKSEETADESGTKKEGEEESAEAASESEGKKEDGEAEKKDDEAEAEGEEKKKEGNDEEKKEDVEKENKEADADSEAELQQRTLKAAEMAMRAIGDQELAAVFKLQRVYRGRQGRLHAKARVEEIKEEKRVQAHAERFMTEEERILAEANRAAEAEERRVKREQAKADKERRIEEERAHEKVLAEEAKNDALDRKRMRAEARARRTRKAAAKEARLAAAEDAEEQAEVEELARAVSAFRVWSGVSGAPPSTAAQAQSTEKKVGAEAEAAPRQRRNVDDLPSVALLRHLRDHQLYFLADKDGASSSWTQGETAARRKAATSTDAAVGKKAAGAAAQRRRDARRARRREWQEQRREKERVERRRAALAKEKVSSDYAQALRAKEAAAERARAEKARDERRKAKARRRRREEVHAKKEAKLDKAATAIQTAKRGKMGRAKAGQARALRVKYWNVVAAKIQRQVRFWEAARMAARREEEAMREKQERYEMSIEDIWAAEARRQWKEDLRREKIRKAEAEALQAKIARTRARQQAKLEARQKQQL